MMNMDPSKAKGLSSMRDVAYYWMQNSYMLSVEKQALQAILKENGIEIDMYHFIKKMNEVANEIRCLDEKLSRKKSTRPSKIGIVKNKLPS